MEPSPFVGRTYFAGDTSIDVPPAYFLQRLYDYDAMLVMFPSLRIPGAYVLARRRERTAGLSDKALAESCQQPDTRTCLNMGWVPVCVVYKTGPSWNPEQIIKKLMARDIWTAGGADKVADALEAQEDAEKASTKQAIRDDLWNRSGDAWRSYQARTGQNNLLPHGELPRPKVADEKTPSPLEAPQDSGAEKPSA